MHSHDPQQTRSFDGKKWVSLICDFENNLSDMQMMWFLFVYLVFIVFLIVIYYSNSLTKSVDVVMR